MTAEQPNLLQQTKPAKAVVISGASKGIGRAIALDLAARGWLVFAGVRQAADGDALCQASSRQASSGQASSRPASSGKIVPLLFDVTQPAQIQVAAATVEAARGAEGVQGLINNAGIAVAAPLEFIPLGELRHQLEVNVVGQVGVTQALLPLLRCGQGRIINISSMAGRVAGPWTGPYHASKFALEALTDSLRQELAPWQIAVISVAPGVIATPIWQHSLARARQLLSHLPARASELYGRQLDKRIARAERNLSRGGSPQRVATVVHGALTARRPRTRYVVGIDANIAIHLLARLPDRWRDWVIARQLS